VVTEEDVRRVALSLPGAGERESYGGRPSWRTQPRMFAWIRDEPDALVVWVESLEDKEALIGAKPDAIFTTPHYDGQPIVLARLEAIGVHEARELIIDSWRLRAPPTLVRAWERDPGRSGVALPPPVAWQQERDDEAGGEERDADEQRVLGGGDERSGAVGGADRREERGADDRDSE